MNIRMHARLLLMAVAVVTAPLPLHNAWAQGLLSFLWGGGSREVVSFHPSHQPGQIIVSFGDKRLYLIHRRGEAISYPIAISREKSRWAGVTRVSDKRANPGWTPTGDATRKSPPPRSCAGWPSPKSFGSAGSLPWFKHVPHPRH
jgi:hypothetical protein